MITMIEKTPITVQDPEVIDDRLQIKQPKPFNPAEFQRPPIKQRSGDETADVIGRLSSREAGRTKSPDDGSYRYQQGYSR
jgi:hypothetical protein